jgi:hypothetical protein
MWADWPAPAPADDDFDQFAADVAVRYEEALEVEAAAHATLAGEGGAGHGFHQAAAAWVLFVCLRRHGMWADQLLVEDVSAHDQFFFFFFFFAQPEFMLEDTRRVEPRMVPGSGRPAMCLASLWWTWM